jgi:hypothetical protein
MPPEEFKLTISAREGPQTYALDRATTGQFSTKAKKYSDRTIGEYQAGFRVGK